MSSARDIAIEDIREGDAADLSWTADSGAIDSFAQLSGDENPLHMDAAHARANGFDDRLAHSFLLAAKVSNLIGMMLPGRRCLLVEETLAFPNPTYPGDTVTFSVEVNEVRPEMALVKLKIKGEKKTGVSPRTVIRGSVTCKILS